MNESASLRLEHQNALINDLHYYIADRFPEGTVLFSQISVKVLIVLFIFLVLDWFQRKVLLRMVKKIIPKTRNIWMNTLMEREVFTSFFHLLPLGICYLLVPLIFYHHPQSFHILDLVFTVFLIVFLAKFFIHLIEAYTEIKNKDQSYRNVALKSFSELLKLLIILFTSFIVISILFDLTSSKVFTFIGAIMAVILLVFRDPILGFVAGINIANSKQIKVGDWVAISKYNNLEGTIKDINLVTTKIQNLDKTISTIPTYDLISTEVKNYETMRGSHTRRIKRSLLLNLKSVKFVDEVLFTDLLQIDILNEYLQEEKKAKPDREKTSLGTFHKSENESDLTNLGVFRHYIQFYLESLPAVSNKDAIMVRLLESTIYGVPVEIYCFTLTSDWKKYEDIQSLIFEHLMAMAPWFQLELVVVDP